MSSQPAETSALTKKKAKSKVKIPILAASAILAGGLGWWGWGKIHPSEDTNAKLLTEVAKKGDIVESVSATGSVTAQTGAQVKIGSQITGRIKRLYADVGSQVRSGDMIAELDLPDIQAQLRQSQASLASARTRLAQQLSGVGMQKSQTGNAVLEAEATLNSARARLSSARENSGFQKTQTPLEILRAKNAARVAEAALKTAESNLRQVKASVKLQIANANEVVAQMKATAANAAINLKRQRELQEKGFVAQSVVDSAEASNSVAQSQVQSAIQNVELVKEKASADLETAENVATQARQNVESAESSLKLASAGTFSDRSKQADVENALAQVKQATAALQISKGNTAQDTLKLQDVQAARDAVQVAQAQTDYYRAQLDKTVIRSPISGTVLQLASQQGETLAAGLSAPTLIIVADLKRLQVDAFVDETDIGKVAIGQEADITVDAFPKKIFKGHVTKVASGSTIQQGVITYDVTLALDGVEKSEKGDDKAIKGAKDEKVGKSQADGQVSGAKSSKVSPMSLLKPDMTASVTLQTGKRNGVLLVPSEAVKVGKRGITVNVVTRKDGKDDVQPKKVKTGSSDGSYTEIKEGLNEGDTVVLAGMDSGQKGPGPSSPFGPAQSKGGGGGGRRGM